MAPSPFVEPLAALREAITTIQENADFVLRELPTLSLDATLQGAVEAVWLGVQDIAGSEVPCSLLRLEDYGTPAASPAADPHAELEWIEDRLAMQVAGLDGAVRLLKDAGTKRVASAEVLVMESSVNVFTAFRLFRRHVHSIRALLPPPDLTRPTARAEAGLPDGVEARQDLACAACRRAAATFEIGIDRWSGNRALLFSGITRSKAFPLTLAANVLRELQGGRISSVHSSIEEGIDAYCPACDRIYCRDHYLLDVEYDEGFYDCTRATCPEGHRRMVDD
jgi:hypothetical protein